MTGPLGYLDFVRAKIIDLPPLGLPIAAEAIDAALKPHQRDVVAWGVAGGRRAYFMNFGLGKTLIQLETLRQIRAATGGLSLIVAPLNVILEGTFDEDAARIGVPCRFVRSDAEIDRAIAEGFAGQYLTNYESVREGKIDPARFDAASLDEADCLRGMGGSKTFREFMRLFDGLPYKFVATATPSPNEYVELLAYAAFLEVMDVGQAKTRFFRRNSEEADDLTIHPHKVEEFWLWVNSWAAFVQAPSDLGHSDEGYALPPIRVRWHEVASDHSRAGEEKGGQRLLLKKDAIGVVEASREKRDSIDARVAKMLALRAEDPGAHRLIWHDLERERAAIERAIPARWFGRWGEVKDGHPLFLAMVDRHYPSRTLGDDRKLGLGPGEKMVLIADTGDAVFGWRKFIDDSGEQGVNCAIFRNEGDSTGSDLIRQAMAAAWSRWPGERLYTYVDPEKVGGNPAGSCFRHAGWRECRALASGLIVLEALPGTPVPEIVQREGLVTVFGTQDAAARSAAFARFKQGGAAELATKPVIAGAGCNFQKHCAWEIFLGIGFKFRDFIQAIHRVQRFGQSREVRIDLIYTEAERAVRAELERKWRDHDAMCARMREIIRRYGLGLAGGTDALARTVTAESTGEREAGPSTSSGRAEWEVWRGDSVIETRRMEAGSVGLIVTSVPFGTQYEYSPSYNDFGHTDDLDHFFAQMDYLSPELLRVLQPGRRMAVHVKDRVVPSGLTGLGFRTIEPFHARGIEHYRAHGFAYLGMITIVTDVVRENAGTYRLGWSEQCKDASGMGVGLPEYLLLFRKPPSDRSNGYADVPVAKAKPLVRLAEGETVDWDDPAAVRGGKAQTARLVGGSGYSRARWQTDASGYWRSNGDRLLEAADLVGIPHDAIYKLYRGYSFANVYDHEQHVALMESVEARHALPTDFALMPVQSWSPYVWSDVARMLGANTLQSAKGREQHLCPLPFDIVDRAVLNWSMAGETVFDPFGGLMTVPLRAVKHGRRGAAIELNPGYFADGVKLLREQDAGRATPGLFDLLDQVEEAA